MNKVKNYSLYTGAAFIIYFLSSLLIITVKQTETGYLLFETAPFMKGFILKTTLIVFSLAFLKYIVKQPLKNCGFSRPGKRSWLLIALLGVVSGACATLFILILSAKPSLSSTKDLSFAEIVIFMWIYSSISEEIFMRGAIHSGMLKFRRAISPSFFRPSQPTIICALIFSLMHSPLLLTGSKLITVSVIMLSCFWLGLTAGYLREKSNSIIPSVFIHIMYNAGTLAGGIVWTVWKSQVSM